MSWSILCAAIWAILATGVAMMPMRMQFKPGFVLLIAAPVLIVWLGIDQGWIVAAAALAGFLSMFRNPIRYYWKKWRGTLSDTPVATEKEGEQA